MRPPSHRSAHAQPRRAPPAQPGVEVALVAAASCSRRADSTRLRPGGGLSMPHSRYHLAQVNIARMRAPLDHPIMIDFVAQLDRINTLADATPGFVWRLQTARGNATAI